jgi:hypothetical protein
MKKSGASLGQPASELISNRIAELGDWRGKTLGRMRKLVKQADPDVVKEWKWSTPVWSHDGIICTGESYKKVVKLTFAKGASLKDPARLFNSSLDGNVRRAIDIHEGEEVDESAFKALIRQAVALNSSGESKASKKAKSRERVTFKNLQHLHSIITLACQSAYPNAAARRSASLSRRHSHAKRNRAF